MFVKNYEKNTTVHKGSNSKFVFLFMMQMVNVVFPFLKEENTNFYVNGDPDLGQF